MFDLDLLNHAGLWSIPRTTMYERHPRQTVGDATFVPPVHTGQYGTSIFVNAYGSHENRMLDDRRTIEYSASGCAAANAALRALVGGQATLYAKVGTVCREGRVDVLAAPGGAPKFHLRIITDLVDEPKATPATKVSWADL